MTAVGYGLSRIAAGDRHQQGKQTDVRRCEPTAHRACFSDSASFACSRLRPTAHHSVARRDYSSRAAGDCSEFLGYLFELRSIQVEVDAEDIQTFLVRLLVQVLQFRQ
jgi:hypothetical protein